jgi:hypothetical protein
MTETMTENAIDIDGIPVDVGPRITRNVQYPPLALDLLLDIVAWARHENDPKFLTWGTWNQQSWAEVETDGDLAPMLRALADKYEDANDYEMRALVEDEAVATVESALRANVCGSAFCMAGQAAYQAGFRLILDDTPLSSIGETIYASDCIAEAPTGVKNDKGYIVYKDVEGASPLAIHVVAERALGLTSDEADWLFDGDNEIDKIHEIVNRIVTSRGLPTPFPNYGTYSPDEDSDY